MMRNYTPLDVRNKLLARYQTYGYDVLQSL